MFSPSMVTSWPWGSVVVVRHVARVPDGVGTIGEPMALLGSERVQVGGAVMERTVSMVAERSVVAVFVAVTELQTVNPSNNPPPELRACRRKLQKFYTD